MLIKYIKSVFWRVAKCLSYIEEARCLKVKTGVSNKTEMFFIFFMFPLVCVFVLGGSVVTLSVSNGNHLTYCSVAHFCSAK